DRLDAMHRADPCHHPGGGGFGGDRHQGGGAAGDLFAWARRPVRAGGIRGRALCEISYAVSRPPCPYGKSDGRTSGGNRAGVPVRLLYAAKQLADRNVSGAEHDRVRFAVCVARIERPSRNAGPYWPPAWSPDFAQGRSIRATITFAVFAFTARLIDLL